MLTRAAILTTLVVVCVTLANQPSADAGAAAAPAGQKAGADATGPARPIQSGGDRIVKTYWELLAQMWAWVVVFLVIALVLTYKAFRHYRYDLAEASICPQATVDGVAAKLNGDGFVKKLDDRASTFEVLKQVRKSLMDQTSVYAQVIRRGIDDLAAYLSAVRHESRARGRQTGGAGEPGAYRFSEIMKPGMAEEMLRLSGELERRLHVVDWISATAPMIGLMGTVWGMIQAFQHISESKGQANAALLGGDISVALWTTLGGLAIAIPGMYIAGALRNRLHRLLDRCEISLRRTTSAFWGRHI